MAAEKLKALGWKPTMPFEESLRETVQWYVDNERWWRPISQKLEYQAFIKAFYGPGLGNDL
jgi:dTDP-glucose 4,6-dehydratase